MAKIKLPRVAVLDFETEGIEGRPKYPPKPVGFSLLLPGRKKSRYYAWGHPCENNCTFEEARNALLAVWEDPNVGILMHNSKFDYDVAMTHMKMKPLPWQRLHDTLFLLFLRDPHANTLALKPASEAILGLAPEERDLVKDWVLANVEAAKRKKSEWGKYICLAPGKLVGNYADGDVVRTDGLFAKVYPEIVERGMLDAYDRERQLMPILLRNEQEGIRADLDALVGDRTQYEKAMGTADAWLRKRLKAPDLNVDSNDELAAILESTGIVTEWEVTKTGKNSTAKKNMTPEKFSDAKVASVLGYRNRLATCLSVFFDPWIEMAERSGGQIYTNWNQVRQAGSGGFAGARTGRMSCNPNFMNIPKDFEGKGDGYVPPRFLKSLPDLPLMRKYILPDMYARGVEGIFLHRDYNQQELRILGHFEDGDLCARYNADPRMDIHTFVQDLIREITGHEFPRSAVKIVNFGKVYGMGVTKLALAIQSTVEDARRLAEAHRKALPGVRLLEQGIKTLSKAGEPIRTWGGREYFCEEPREINGRMQTFEYKLLNYLIQGSAADCTKEAIIRYDAVREKSRFLVTVHDEINLSCPPSAVKREMQLLREAMHSVEFDVPMLSDGKTGPRWGALTKYEEK